VGLVSRKRRTAAVSKVERLRANKPSLAYRAQARHRCIDALAGAVDAPLVEAYFRGRSATETAAALGLPVRVVKVRIYNALRELRRGPAVAGLTVRPTAGRNPVAA
jgi:DNA-directed RNA polymerase specialized sigma24 family protein